MFMKKLRVGIAGFGVVGKRRKQYLDNNPNVKVVGVCDKTFPQNGQLSDKTLSFSNYHHGGQ